VNVWILYTSAHLAAFRSNVSRNNVEVVLFDVIYFPSQRRPAAAATAKSQVTVADPKS